MAISARAQDAPQNGYELLVKAGKSYVAGAEGSPPPKNLTPQENLRRQRVSVARNARTLKLIRQALQKSIEPPPLTDIAVNSSNNSNWRKLARLLAQESAVHVAERKPVDAMNSHLDAIEMGASVAPNGAIINVLFGLAIENIGRSNMEVAAGKLDAAQCRAAIGRLAKIEKLRPTIDEVLRGEAAFVRRGAAKVLAERRNPKKLANNEDFQAASEADKRTMLSMTPARLHADLAHLIEAERERSDLSYQAAKKTRFSSTNNPYLKSLAEILEGPGLRFNFEKNVTQDRLWRAALELRAQKLETGVYPRKFAAPRDPFSNKPLIYKYEGEIYRLYSVGPDGRDDSGAPIQTIETKEETGTKTVTQRLTVESTGDIAAPKF